MKASSRNSILLPLAICATLACACTSPGYNDNPSQQISRGRVGCPAATEFFALYFSLRVQPAVENPEGRIVKEIFRSYCHHIPAPGMFYLTADLVGGELKKTPLAMKVVEENSGTSEEPRTIAEYPAKVYDKGVIESSFPIDHIGNFAIYLTRGQDASPSEVDRLRIPLYVGVEPPATLLIVNLLKLAGIGLGVAGLGYLLFRSLRKRGIG